MTKEDNKINQLAEEVSNLNFKIKLDTIRLKKIKEQFSVSDVLKDNSLLDHLKQQEYHKKLLDPMIIKEKFSINNEQIQRMESNAVQLLKDLQQLKYMNKNEKVVAE